MAEDTLPPLEEMPEAILTPDQTSHAADWAATFGGSDTNLAQRVRHNQDIAAYTKAIQDQQAAHLQDKIATDQTAQNLWFRQQELAQRGQTHESTLAQRDAEFQQNLALRQSQADSVNAVRAMQANHAKVAADHLTGFATTMNQAIAAGATPGTQAYRNAALNALTTYPAVNPQVAQRVFGLAKIQATPDEVLSTWNTIPPEQRAVTSFSTNADGTLNFRARNVTPEELQRQQIAEQNSKTGAIRERRLGEKHALDIQMKKEFLGPSGTVPPAAPVPSAVPVVPSGPVKVGSAEDFHALPSGAVFIDPNGIKRTKP